MRRGGWLVGLRVVVVPMVMVGCGATEAAGELCGNSACRSGWLCQEGICLEACNTFRDCTAFGQTCDRGLCRTVTDPECQAPSDCTSPGPCESASGAECKIGSCVYSVIPGCVELFALGQACDRDTACNSGHCTDGVCCDEACDGACMDCSSSGRCDTTPADDDACGVIDCDALDTACRDYSDLTAARCQGFGTCKSTSSTDCNVFDDQPTSTVCRPAGGPCDAVDSCDGTGSCAPDSKQSTQFVCRVSLGVCDLEEMCDGASNACPADSKKGDTFECRPSQGLCDTAETCDGLSEQCPSDILEASGIECRASTEACDPADLCDGISQLCADDNMCTTFADISVTSGVNDGGQVYGSSWGDYDADGYVDLYFAGWFQAEHLFHNDGDGSFTRVTSFNESATRSGKWTDIDNDGDLDLLVTRGANGPDEWEDRLFENDGAGAFTERGIAANLNGTNLPSAVPFDYNGDGCTDYFYFTGSSSGTVGFDVRVNDCQLPAAFSIVDATALGLPNWGNGEIAAGADIDNDSDMDFLYFDSSGALLIRNNGDGTFSEDAVAAGIGATEYNGQQPYFAVTFGDYDADGWMDLFLGRPSGRPNLLYHNDGDGTFTLDSALNVDLGVSRGASWGDFNNDGRLDLLVSNQGAPNALYRNNGDGTFTDVAVDLGIDGGLHATTSGTFADIDNDGDLDIFLGGYDEPNILFRNERNDDQYLRVRVVGGGAGMTPTDGVGARVELWDSNSTTLLAVRRVDPGHGLGSQEHNLIHFGLSALWGGASQAYYLIVRFSSTSEVGLPVVPSQESITIGSTIISNAVEIIE